MPKYVFLDVHHVFPYFFPPPQDRQKGSNFFEGLRTGSSPRQTHRRPEASTSNQSTWEPQTRGDTLRVYGDMGCTGIFTFPLIYRYATYIYILSTYYYTYPALRIVLVCNIYNSTSTNGKSTRIGNTRFVSSRKGVCC